MAAISQSINPSVRVRDGMVVVDSFAGQTEIRWDGSMGWNRRQRLSPVSCSVRTTVGRWYPSPAPGSGGCTYCRAERLERGKTAQACTKRVGGAGLQLAAFSRMYGGSSGSSTKYEFLGAGLILSFALRTL